MPSKGIVNPLGQSGEAPDYGLEVRYVQFDPAASGVILSGTVVKVSAAFTTLEQQMLAKITAHGALTFDFIGVAINAPAGGYLPGQVMEIAIAGKVNVLFDANNTTEGHLALQSAATDGNATDSATATVGKTLGIILETAIVGAANTLIPVLLRFM